MNVTIADFASVLKQRVLESIGRGKRQIVLWGFNPDCANLLGDLEKLGLLNHVSGIVDPSKTKHGQIVFNKTVVSPEKIGTLPMDTLAIIEDENKEEALKAFVRVDSRIPEVIIVGSKHFDFKDELFEKLVASCPVKSKAGGYNYMLIHIYQSLRQLLERKVEGSIAEFGCFQCGTTVFMAKILEAFGVARKIYAFDTFNGYPPQRSVLDMFASPKCEFRDLSILQAYCKPFPIELVQGDIAETHTRLKGVPLMFTFFDTDNYSPTKAALELCYEQTVDGGILAFDHFFSEAWVDTVGERLAVKEVFQGKNVFHLHGTGIFIKI